MRDRARNVLRLFTALGLWWLCIVPGLHECSAVFIVVSAADFIAAAALYFNRFRILFFFIYAIGILSILYLTFDLWLFPPAVLGLLLPPVFLLLYKLCENCTILDSVESCQIKVNIPHLTRLLIFLIFWMAGLLLIGLSSNPNLAVYLMLWTCFMLVLGRNIWSLVINAEWFGYMMRRKVFVSHKTWKMRFICTLLIGLAIAAGMIAIL